MSNLQINPELRRQAVHLYHHPAEIAQSLGQISLDPPYPKPGSDEALDLDAHVKPPYYALLGAAIEYVVQDVTSRPLSISERAPSQIATAVADALDTRFKSSADKVSQSQLAVLPDLERLKEIRYSLHPHSFDSVYDNISGGAGTAAWAISLLHDELPKGHSEMPTGQRLEYLRRSYAHLITLASVSSKQISSIEDLLRLPGYPEPPRTTRSSKSRTFVYPKNLLDYPMTGEMQMRIELMTGEVCKADTIRDIESKTPVIGCPILFKPGQIQRLWNWSIDQSIALGAMAA